MVLFDCQKYGAMFDGKCAGDPGCCNTCAGKKLTTCSLLATNSTRVFNCTRDQAAYAGKCPKDAGCCRACDGLTIEECNAVVAGGGSAPPATDDTRKFNCAADGSAYAGKCGATDSGCCKGCAGKTITECNKIATAAGGAVTPPPKGARAFDCAADGSAYAGKCGATDSGCCKGCAGKTIAECDKIAGGTKKINPMILVGVGGALVVAFLVMLMLSRRGPPSRNIDYRRQRQ
jgi:hypothetical protein